MNEKIFEQVARFYATATPEEIAHDAGRIANYALVQIDPSHVELLPPRRFQVILSAKVGEEIDMEIEGRGVAACYVVQSLGGVSILEESKPCRKSYL